MHLGGVCVCGVVGAGACLCARKWCATVQVCFRVGAGSRDCDRGYRCTCAGGKKKKKIDSSRIRTGDHSRVRRM